MLSEGILENPAVFSGKRPDLDKIALEYFSYAKKYKTPLESLKWHLEPFFIYWNQRLKCTLLIYQEINFNIIS